MDIGMPERVEAARECLRRTLAWLRDEAESFAMFHWEGNRYRECPVCADLFPRLMGEDAPVWPPWNGFMRCPFHRVPMTTGTAKFKM